jgi:hypothetical protein
MSVAIKENTAGGKTAGASLGVVLFAMSFYMIVSIALVFANKFVLNDAQMDAPIFLTWTQVGRAFDRTQYSGQNRLC